MNVQEIYSLGIDIGHFFKLNSSFPNVDLPIDISRVVLGAGSPLLQSCMLNIEEDIEIILPDYTPSTVNLLGK